MASALAQSGGLRGPVRGFVIPTLKAIGLVRMRLHVAAKDPATLPGDDPTSFFEAWLAFGTGGTCWAGNGALCELLGSLGFRACAASRR